MCALRAPAVLHLATNLLLFLSGIFGSMGDLPRSQNFNFGFIILCAANTIPAVYFEIKY